MKTTYLLLGALLLGTTLGAVSSPWADNPRAAADPAWAWSPSFGWINDARHPYVYQQQHGWLYVAGTDESSLWFHDAKLKAWWWTGSGLYQLKGAHWTYHARAKLWLHFVGGKNAERWWQDASGEYHDDATVRDYGAHVDAMHLAGLLPLSLREFKETYVDPRLPGRVMQP